MVMMHHPERLPDLALETALAFQRLAPVAGVDEAGRGAWAGPVVAAAVILPLHDGDRLAALHGLRDSKKLTAAARLHYYHLLHEIALAIGVGRAEPRTVDQLGLLPATWQAMMAALQALPIRPRAVLIDHLRLPSLPMPQYPLTAGDNRALSIAAAAVVAKVSRDQWMETLDRRFPGYGFAQHKGYGTRRHRHALGRLGPCPIHRRSFAPVASLQESARPGPS
jgi:ribonuclease HII